MAETVYAIKVVARLTKLSPHVIRVWEKRYHAVTPMRTGTNRRVYTQADIERLELLREATVAGHSIGQIAKLPCERLAKIAAELERSSSVTVTKRRISNLATPCLETSLQAIYRLDARQLEKVLMEGIIALGQHGLLERFVCPLVQRIGELWREGSLQAMHEHFASAVIRDFLARNSQPYSAATSMPAIVVATPAGQLHELGALMVSRAASDLGWRVIYIGTSLPAAEIASAAIQNRARAVALSIVYPEDDPALPGELENLRNFLPGEIRIIIGGRAADGYRQAIERIGAVVTKELKGFYDLLDSLRVLATPA